MYHVPVHSKICDGRLSRIELSFSARLPQSEDCNFSSVGERLIGGQGGAHPLAPTISPSVPSVSSKFCKLVVYGVRDYNLDDTQSSHLRSSLASDIALARANPLGSKTGPEG